MATMSNEARRADNADGQNIDGAISVVLEDAYPVVRSWLRRRCQNTEVADDLAQDTMLAAWANRRSIRDVTSLRPWLFRIALNTLNAHFRLYARHPTVSADASEAMSHRIYDAPCQPFEDWLIDTVEIEDTLAALPVADRQVLLLHDYAGCIGDELGEQLGVRPETARKRVARARSHARTLRSHIRVARPRRADPVFGE